MRARVLVGLSVALAAAACGGSGSTTPEAANSSTTTTVAQAHGQQVLRLGQTGQASDTSGNGWRIAVSNPLLVAAWHRNPDEGLQIVVYRVTVANTSGTQDISGTDFEERVTGFPRNDLWSGGGAEADLQQFMSTHKFSPQPPIAGTDVSSGNATATRSYYVAIRFSGQLSQVEFRPFGADDNSAAQLVWR
jgi:hypothetical protein